LHGNFLFSTSDEIAYATDGANSYAYSPILNTWTPAPITLPNSVPKKPLLPAAAVAIATSCGALRNARHSSALKSGRLVMLFASSSG
jgi:hypothetical protein